MACMGLGAMSRLFFRNKQAIGIALESQRLDVIARRYSQTKDMSLLLYAMEGLEQPVAHRDTICTRSRQTTTWRTRGRTGKRRRRRNRMEKEGEGEDGKEGWLPLAPPVVNEDKVTAVLVGRGWGPTLILTVADDLLKNDRHKFLDMMEQLAAGKCDDGDDGDEPEYTPAEGHNLACEGGVG
ncbi:hypothetical protein DFH08DRAFT_810221 [Mycena albidolilacea]|uniref:26S proteasome non-ATPase regulatory subunit 1/RPN2 N-terminal domain-containing protein n=1 Tax=Mycena albidolilacea TaxID=1033008 RepID=A0AAD6ZZ52_9AGAR|nr:hypothetical protein DFH08DRAFT_810221 [Mycena albidolilacea]